MKAVLFNSGTDIFLRPEGCPELCSPEEAFGFSGVYTIDGYEVSAYCGREVSIKVDGAWLPVGRQALLGAAHSIAQGKMTYAATCRKIPVGVVNVRDIIESL